MGLMSLDRWGWGRGHLWTEPGHGVEVGKSNVAFGDSGGGHTGDTGCFEDRAWGSWESQGTGGTLTSMGFCHSSRHLGSAVSEPGFG